MATSMRLRTLASLVSLTTVASTIISSPAVRTALTRLFAPSAHPVRFAALLLAIILNGKNLPFIWHARFARIMLYQLYLQPAPLPRDAIFRPIVTDGMYTPLPECDYNGHKSNSTYFSDLDMARTQLVAVLLRKGIRNAGQHHRRDGRRVDGYDEKNHPLNGADEQPVKGAFMIALGAVSCHFKREIKPYERFEIWTRVLAWDRKWVYVISHMVKAGAVKPDGFDLQPWNSKRPRAASGAEQVNGAATAAEVEQKAEWKKAIFATSISKYVVKKGRLTIAPEVVLQNSDLLPPKPGTPEAEDSKLPANWTWEAVEAEKERGLRIAEHFDALDAQGGLHDEFPICSLEFEREKGRVLALGEYKDLYFG
ncbi:hypothetical protein FH972_021740 [Carpinus fangiana]|uniref:Thioesterase domain-containing protein n=1 Tax=Carpinus fangiana TaxID=176857 RepID=A0A5N6KQ83_9ROSI|nr:hypothetical protein FH972_021740 [Carpinus fangiana]